jgi:hypothetical protein
MRDQNRIPRILKLLETKWTSTPDQRFGQMLINNGVLPDTMSTWLMEDDDLEKHLKFITELKLDEPQQYHKKK